MSSKSSASSDESGEGGADVHAYLTDTKVAAAVTKFSRSFKSTAWSAIKQAEKDAMACAKTSAAKKKLTKRMVRLPPLTYRCPVLKRYVDEAHQRQSAPAYG